MFECLECWYVEGKRRKKEVPSGRAKHSFSIDVLQFCFFIRQFVYFVSSAGIGMVNVCKYCKCIVKIFFSVLTIVKSYYSLFCCILSNSIFHVFAWGHEFVFMGRFWMSLTRPKRFTVCSGSELSSSRLSARCFLLMIQFNSTFLV